MNLTVLLGLVTGSDNLYFGAAWGLLPLSAGRRLAFALAFGAAELGMTLAGYALGASAGVGGELAGAAALALTGILVLVGCARRADLARLSGHPAALIVLPLALSFDNLASGAALGTLGASPISVALGAGLMSAVMAAAGLFAAGALARRLPRAAVVLAGAGMLVLAVRGVVETLL